MILAHCQNSNCDYLPSINYTYFEKTSNLSVSVDIKTAFLLDQFGAFDEMTLLKLSGGIRLSSDRSSQIYDIALLKYQSLFRLPIIKDKSFNVLDSNNLGKPKYYLKDSYTTFLSLSYQGLSFTNSGIYNKDYNWSSVGVDILYKKFKTNNHFYTKLSFITSASTLENNPNYFSDIDSINKSEFCFSTKISSISKLLFGHYSTIKMEVSYRDIYNYLKQKEICAMIYYEYFHGTGLILNAQLGYSSYGTCNIWKNYSYLSVGLAYRIK